MNLSSFGHDQLHRVGSLRIAVVEIEGKFPGREGERHISNFRFAHYRMFPEGAARTVHGRDSGHPGPTTFIRTFSGKKSSPATFVKNC